MRDQFEISVQLENSAKGQFVVAGSLSTTWAVSQGRSCER